MFAVKPQREDRLLNAEIDSLLIDMTTYDKASDEYATMVAHLSTLYGLKSNNAPKRVSPDTIAIVAGNLAGILMIVGHEKAHVVTSKALSFVLKAR